MTTAVGGRKLYKGETEKEKREAQKSMDFPKKRSRKRAGTKMPPLFLTIKNDLKISADELFWSPEPGSVPRKSGRRLVLVSRKILVCDTVL